MINTLHACSKSAASGSACMHARTHTQICACKEEDSLIIDIINSSVSKVYKAGKEGYFLPGIEMSERRGK